MKKASLLFLLCFGVIATTYSQTQNEFVLEKLMLPPNTIQSTCKEDGHRLATIEFFTAIKDVGFETVANNRIVSKEYDEKRGSYILCLRGVDKDWRHIQIDISKNGFMSYPMEAIQIKNGEYLAYKLSPKYDETTKKDYTAQITVYGKDGDPLEGAKLTDKNTGKSELTNSEGVGRINFEKEGQTIYITVSHPSYSDTLNKTVQAGDNLEYTLSKYSPIKPKKVYNAFVTINYAYDIVSGTHSAGISGGKLLFFRNKLGLFLSGSTAFPSETSVIEECDKEGFLADGSRPQYVDYKITPRWSILGGAYWKFDNFYLKGGLGVGTRNVYWQTEDGFYYRNLGFSKPELALTMGVQYHVNQLVLSLDVVTNSFSTAELKVGLGYSF